MTGRLTLGALPGPDPSLRGRGNGPRPSPTTALGAGGLELVPRHQGSDSELSASTLYRRPSVPTSQAGGQAPDLGPGPAGPPTPHSGCRRRRAGLSGKARARTQSRGLTHTVGAQHCRQQVSQLTRHVLALPVLHAWPLPWAGGHSGQRRRRFPVPAHGDSDMKGQPRLLPQGSVPTWQKREHTHQSRWCRPPGAPPCGCTDGTGLQGEKRVRAGTGRRTQALPPGAQVLRRPPAPLHRRRHEPEGKGARPGPIWPPATR